MLCSILGEITPISALDTGSVGVSRVGSVGFSSCARGDIPVQLAIHTGRAVCISGDWANNGTDWVWLVVYHEPDQERFTPEIECDGRSTGTGHAGLRYLEHP
jgi:hypothetical protein